VPFPLPKHIQCCIGFEVPTAVVVKSSILRNMTRHNPLKVNRLFGETCHLHLQHRRISQTRKQCELCLLPAFTLVCCLAYLSLKAEATYSSETSFNSQRTTWCYIAEDKTVHIGFYLPASNFPQRQDYELMFRIEM
jgi:hypothetical protein